jgi:hypothetical protein
LKLKHGEANTYLKRLFMKSPSYLDAAKAARMHGKRPPPVAKFVLQTVRDSEEALEAAAKAERKAESQGGSETRRRARYEPQTDSSTYLRTYLDMTPGIRRDIQDLILEELDRDNREFERNPMLLLRLLQLGGASNQRAEIIVQFWLWRLNPHNKWRPMKDESGEVTGMQQVHELSELEKTVDMALYTDWYDRVKGLPPAAQLIAARVLKKSDVFGNNPAVTSLLDSLIQMLKQETAQ